MKKILCSGSYICDFIAADLPGLGAPGDLIYPPEGIKLYPGGHSANVAIDLIQLGQSDVTTVGSIGFDILGEYLESELTNKGLHVFPERIQGAHTAKNIVLIVKGEDRRFFAELSANTQLSTNHVIKILEKTNPDYFYQGTIGGLKLLDRKIQKLFARAKKLGAVTVVDVVRPYLGGWDELIEVFDLIDIFHCNEYEIQALTGKKDPLKGCKELFKNNSGFVIVTLGPRGLVAGWQGDLFQVPAFKVQTIDPTGAGDAFCAGIIDAVAQFKKSDKGELNLSKNNIKMILLKGSAAGAACVTSIGATPSVTRKNLDSLMNEQGKKILIEIKS